MLSLIISALSFAAVLVTAPHGVLGDTSPDTHKILYNGKAFKFLPASTPPQWVASIKADLKTGETGYCTGTLLTPRIVLTVGHCLIEAEAVSVGFADADGDFQSSGIEAKEWVWHFNYNGGHADRMLGSFSEQSAHEYADLAIILLEDEIEDIAPITLAPPSFNVGAPNIRMHVFGWRRDALYQVEEAFQYLQIVKARWIGDSSSLVGPLGSGGQWCVRDSGGPVTIVTVGPDGTQQLYLVGVAFGFLDGITDGDPKKLKKVWGSLKKVPKCGQRVMYVHVASNLSWIKSAVDHLAPGEAARIKSY